MKKIIGIEGMCCARCAARVEKRLIIISNVVSVDVKFKKNLAVVRSRIEIPDEQIVSAVVDAGFKVLSIESK